MKFFTGNYNVAGILPGSCNPRRAKTIQYEHRWLLAGQERSGAIREEIGEPGKGGFPPPASNEAYGTTETPLIQSNDDGVSDLLYTVAFAFLGLHEDAAATEIYRMAKKYYLVDDPDEKVNLVEKYENLKNKSIFRY